MQSDPAAVAADLEAWCRSGGILDKDGPSASIHLFDPVARRRTRDAIVDAYLAEQTDVGVGRQFLALATAGPPGVGKSSSIDRRHLAGQGWRVLDADKLKDYLLRDAIEQGIYTDLLNIELADGHRLLPRELATLVHTESTKLLDMITEICLSRGENLVLEGTFSWPGLGPRLLRDLAYADYEKFTILDVEAPQHITRARALTRWWRGRQIPAPDDDRLDHRGPVPGAETRREVATRVEACVRELMADRDHDHVVVTHGYAQTFVVTTWLQVPTEAVGFASFATRPGAITHLRHDDYWRNRAVVALADTSHLDDGLQDPHRKII